MKLRDLLDRETAILADVALHVAALVAGKLGVDSPKRSRWRRQSAA